jgi:dTDP-4-dehydrorhamnose 3,5-epimerase-like enzyme
MGFVLQSRHLEDIAVIVPKAQRDERGFFMEVYRADQFKELGLPVILSKIIICSLAKA